MAKKTNDKIDLTKITFRPGVYLMKDKEGAVLYVGKAKNLKKRVSSYFTKIQGHSIKTRTLVSKIADLETIAVTSEVEALVLENELIKKYRPPFNVLMRDDKSYLYLRVTMQDEFPRILLARRIAKDGARYFGPFVSSRKVHEALRFIKKVFPLCGLTSQITAQSLKARKPRACLNYHLGICPGVCLGLVDSRQYHEIFKQVLDFLEGKYDVVLKDLRGKMKTYSAKKEYEKAARIRDSIMAIESLGEKQRVVMADTKAEMDVIGLARQLNKGVVAILKIRMGKLLDQEFLVVESKYETDDTEVLRSFVREYYALSADIPKTVLVAESLAEAGVFGDWLSTLRGTRVEVNTPTRGNSKKLVDLATANARLHFSELAEKWGVEKQGAVEGIRQLQEILGLKQINRIEAYDISNTQGADSVGSMVVFEDGKMAKDQYRRFKIKTVIGPDDFASLAEVLARRFAKDVGDSKFARLPDVVMIDGGKGQVNIVARELKSFSVKIVGMVKGRPMLMRADGSIVRADSHGQKAQDDLVLPFTAKPIELKDNSPVKYLLQNIRDEAHRFAISFHRALRTKRMKESGLEKIPGIGPATRKKLLKKFGSMAAVKNADESELSQVVGEKLAKKIRVIL
jgi:excinuclease ABC subunit C